MSTNPCTDCEQGKHQNCDGDTWDGLDFALCPCAERGHELGKPEAGKRNPEPGKTEKPERVPEHNTTWLPEISREPLGRVLCTGTSKRSGLPCQCLPMHGGTVCSAHGGMAPQVKAAAKRRLVAQAVKAEVDATLAYEAIVGVTNPIEALAELASEVRATVAALGARVNALNDIRYSAPGSGTEQIRAEMQLLGQYQDRLGRFLDLLVKSGFEEKRIILDQARAALMVRVLDRIFDGLELSPMQRLLIPLVVPAAIREIAQ